MSSYVLNQTTILECNDEMEATECCLDDHTIPMEKRISTESNQISRCDGEQYLLDTTEQQSGEEQQQVSVFS